MRRLDYGPDVPDWAINIFERFTQQMGDRPTSPTKLVRLPTTGLPAASAWPGTAVFDTTTKTVKVSDGTSWNTLGGSSGVTVAQAVAFAVTL